MSISAFCHILLRLSYLLTLMECTQIMKSYEDIDIYNGDHNLKDIYEQKLLILEKSGLHPITG